MCQSKAQGGLRCVSHIAQRISPHFEQSYDDVRLATRGLMNAGGPTTAWMNAMDACKSAAANAAPNDHLAEATQAFLEAKEQELLLLAEVREAKSRGVKQTSEMTQALTHMRARRKAAHRALSNEIDYHEQGVSHLGMRDFNLDTRYPIPQDMPLEKASAVLQLIDDGETTDADIAHCLGQLSTQQGNYAANAVCYLGLASRDKDMTPSQLSLTEQGSRFLAASPEDQLKILAHLVQQMDTDDLANRGYSDVTMNYRTQTRESWRNFLASKGAATVLTNSVAAAQQMSASPNRPARIIPKPVNAAPPPPPACPTCNLTLLPTGECGNCW